MNGGDGRGDADRDVCVDMAMRRSWQPVEVPVKLREREREYELVQGPEHEETDARGGGERGDWVA
jgi:hypothetical protein